MTYTPQPGDIGLTVITGAGGKAIRLGQWLNGDGFADVEHAFVVAKHRQGLPTVPWIVEAMPGGARYVKNWHPADRTVYLRCPDEHRDAVAEAARDMIGVPYSWADYGALALHRFHIPTPHLRHYIETSGHMICSQLADRAAEKGGWRLFADGRWHGDVTPADLNRLYVAQRLARLAAGDSSR